MTSRDDISWTTNDVKGHVGGEGERRGEEDFSSSSLPPLREWGARGGGGRKNRLPQPDQGGP